MMTAKYSFGAQGNKHLLLAAADALEETQEQFFKSSNLEHSPEYFNKIPALRQNNTVMAFGGLEVVGTLVFFISTYFAEKIFDEVYDRTFKRPISNQLDKFFEKFVLPEGKFIEYRDIVYLEDIDLVVIVSALTDKGNTKTLEENIIQAHQVAYKFIERNGRKAPIHCHKIINGSVMLEPVLLDNITQLNNHKMIVKSKTVSLKK